MLHTIKFSLIKGIGLISKRKLIEQEGSSEMAFLKLKSELLKIRSKKSLRILKQMNSTSLSQQALDIAAYSLKTIYVNSTRSIYIAIPLSAIT